MKNLSYKIMAGVFGALVLLMVLSRMFHVVMWKAVSIPLRIGNFLFFTKFGLVILVVGAILVFITKENGNENHT